MNAAALHKYKTRASTAAYRYVPADLSALSGLEFVMICAAPSG